MTCREFADFMMDYLSGELPTRVRSEFDHHLSVCANCVKYLTSYRETIALGKRAFDDDGAPVPTDVPEDLVKAILSSTKR